MWEFPYSINNQLCHMVFTSVTGHLKELEFIDGFKKWHSCSPGDLFHAPVRKSVPQVQPFSTTCLNYSGLNRIHFTQEKLRVQENLIHESQHAEWLVLWLDCDREGENIAFEVCNTIFPIFLCTTFPRTLCFLLFSGSPCT